MAFQWQGERLRFSGELRKRKVLAEHAAARNALDSLQKSEGKALFEAEMRLERHAEGFEDAISGARRNCEASQ